MIKQIKESMNKHKESLFVIVSILLIGDAVYEFYTERKMPFGNLAIVLLLLPSSFEKYIPEEKFKIINRVTDVLAIIFVFIALYFAFFA